MDILKYILILLSASAGILGSFLDLYHADDSGSKKLTTSGRILIAVIVTSVAITLSIQYFENKKAEEIQAEEKKLNNERIQTLSEITKTLNKSVEVNDIIYQNINQIKKTRIWIDYEIDLTLETSGYSQNDIPKDMQHLWIKDVVEDGLKEIFHNYTGDDISDWDKEAALNIKTGSLINKITGWKIGADENDTYLFKIRNYKKNHYIPLNWKENDAVFTKTLFVDREKFATSYNDLINKTNSPKFLITERVAFYLEGAVAQKTALYNMQSEDKRKWPMSPPSIFYRPNSKKVYFSIFTDVKRNIDAQNADINFNLKDLKYSKMYLEDKYSWFQGPGIKPIKIRFEAKDIPKHYYKLKTTNFKAPSSDIDVYALIPVSRAEYNSISPTHYQGYSWSKNNKPWKF